MTDAQLAGLAPAADEQNAPPAASRPTETNAEARAFRTARFADIERVHGLLMEAIEASPFYGETFKTFEKQRLSKPYLMALIDADPRHIVVMLHKDEPVGFMLSSPELGVLWLHWSYIAPAYRKSGLAVTTLKGFVALWNKDRFHKIATYTRPGNRVARVLMERFGFTLTATLRDQLFGEDQLLFEHTLEKTLPGYDHGLSMGLKTRLRYWIRALVKV